MTVRETSLDSIAAVTPDFELGEDFMANHFAGGICVRERATGATGVVAWPDFFRAWREGLRQFDTVLRRAVREVPL